jgi:hypothetical protein
VNHVAYPHHARACARSGISGPALLAVGFAFATGLACTAGVRSSGAGNGGTVGTTGTAGTNGRAGTSGSGRAGVTGSDVGIAGTAGTPNPDAAACQQMDVMFTPTNPTVYLLVDRSGSMFHCLTGSTGDAVCSDPANTSWSNLKMAIEAVIPPLASQVRFGFTTVYGTNPASGGMCPSLQKMLTNNVPPALNNAGPITTLYDSLLFPPNSTQAGIKFESPISESLGNVTQALIADQDPGSKYIIFITDGQPDYCDDSNSLCAPDSVIWQLQQAKAANISTIVFGVQTALFDLAPGVLQAFANAGAGEPTVAPVKAGGSTFDFYDQCDGVAGWAADLAVSGKPSARGTTLGTYSATAGTTMPYTPSASDESQLVSQLSMALSGVRSCTFDLSKFTIDLTKLNEALVYLVDSTGAHVPVSLDPGNANGWDMSTASELQLYGTACTQLRDPGTMDIKFNFPCDIVIPPPG